MSTSSESMIVIDTVSDATALSELEVAKSDPIAALVDHIGGLVDYFSPDARELIKQSLEQDKLRAEHLSCMESALRDEGDIQAVRRVVDKSRDLCESSMSQVLPMRRHLNDIADALNELTQSDVLEDPSAMSSIISEIKESAGNAFKSAVDGRARIASFATELRTVQEEHVLKAVQSEVDGKKHAAEAEEHQDTAACQGKAAACSAGLCGVTGTGTAGGAGVGCLAVLNGASWVASVPYIGGALTTTTTTSVGGFWGFFGCTSTAVAFSPVGLVVGGGLCALFGIFSLSQLVQARHHSELKAVALRKQTEAEAEKARSEDIAKHSTEISRLTLEMMDAADFHKDMWAGIECAAENAAHSFHKLAKTDPKGARARRFQARMREFAEQMINFVVAIDEYLFWLSRAGYFPKNYNLQKVIGTRAYKRMEDSLSQATIVVNRQPVAETLK
eukprot:TRINITY_DN121959_c0_g1_i1.p1 TRINITY_DN121959_c0_g1~~TRINITY_DN121959_c0_g1_i1.p1  ORF type:complete len:446 (+),score=95.88 TRINITY_DN121959_c0_g1_i1:125-1462(+)